jgi:CheY-like chemotaxis protein
MLTPLPNGRRPETGSVMTDDDPAALRARIHELERLCAEVYVAAVELGLPQSLLNRLWTVAAHGSSPMAFDLDMPPRPAAPGAAAVPAREPMPLPDIRLTDRPRQDNDREGRKAALPELKPLPERRTVMVVDDDVMMMEVLVRILHRENYELITAGSGPDALRLAAAHEGPIHLLVTDYAMPDMKGPELADRMRERYPDIAVLYQTGFSDMLFENKAELEEGAAFVEKPFTARGLREAARMILFGALNPAAS